MDDGFSSHKTQEFILRYSDDGKNWSKPRYLKKILRAKMERINSGSPANGIVLRRGKHRGRIITPMFNDKVIEQKSGKRDFLNSALYSDNSDERWRRSKHVPIAKNECNECLITELDNGNILNEFKLRTKST